MNFLTVTAYLKKGINGVVPYTANLLIKNLLPLLFVFSLAPSYAEYTVGMRTFSGGNLIIGQVGARPFVGAPPIVSIPFVMNFQDANVSFGAELFGEVGLTPSIYLEPHIGYLYQGKEVNVPGIETNINGKTSFSDDITVNQKLYNLTFGLSVKGKTPDLRKTWRFGASFGFQFMRINSISLTYFNTPNTVDASGNKVAGDKLAITVHDTSQLSRWGMRLLSGLSVDYFNPLLAGVVIQAELRLGFDVSNILFNSQAFENIVVANGISADLRRTYLEFSGGMYLGAAYRLPFGGGAKAYKDPNAGKRPGSVDG